MKTKRLILILILVTSLGYGQDNNNQKVVFITIGKPWHPDISKNLNTLSFSVNFQNRFVENFAYEPFYTFAKSNSYPMFFNDKVKLNRYLLSQIKHEIIFNTSLWSDIFTHSLGIKTHYAFVNSNNWFFSFNFSVGYFLSKASKFEIGKISHNSQTGEIYTYESSVLEDKFSGLFIGPGIQVNYSLTKKIIIGIDLNAHFSQLSDEKFSKVPEIPDYYNLAIILGMKL